MTEAAAIHREVLELLPWYVNGTLGDEQRTRIERHLRDCLPCNAALREERRLSGLVREQDTLPLGPDHGLSELNRRIDQRGREFNAGARDTRMAGPGLRSGGRKTMPWLGYGVAAALGGVVVWAWLATTPGSAPPVDAGFATLTTPAADQPGDVDIVFAGAPDSATLEAFVREYGLRQVAGPSEIGRYSFAVDDREPAAVERLLEALGADPRVRFAGRAYGAGAGAGDLADGADGGNAGATP